MRDGSHVLYAVTGLFQLYDIGIKDIFECFMMVLNHHKSREFVFYSYSKMVT